MGQIRMGLGGWLEAKGCRVEVRRGLRDVKVGLRVWLEAGRSLEGVCVGGMTPPPRKGGEAMIT